jgi:hypothetical protein
MAVAQEPEFMAFEKIMTDEDNIDQIVQDILADMPLEEKVAIAKPAEDKVPMRTVCLWCLHS